MHILKSIHEKQGIRFGARSGPQQSFRLPITAKIPALVKWNRHRILPTYADERRPLWVMERRTRREQNVVCSTSVSGPFGDGADGLLSAINRLSSLGSQHDTHKIGCVFRPDLLQNISSMKFDRARAYSKSS